MDPAFTLNLTNHLKFEIIYTALYIGTAPVVAVIFRFINLYTPPVEDLKTDLKVVFRHWWISVH